MGPTPASSPIPNPEMEELTVRQLGAGLDDGTWTSVELVAAYRARIEAVDRGPINLRSIIAVNPAAGAQAAALDRERAAGRIRGPLHGVPVLIKDNIDTDPDPTIEPDAAFGDPSGAHPGIATTAGSMALVDSRTGGEATVAQGLRLGGAIVLGKTNLSEWANFRSTTSSSGWSAVGGSGRNPYVLDRSPCGSSSGSGAAIAANLAAVAIGTETNGSIVCPSSVNGLVGIKPTVGLVSRAGVVPIASSQDTVGPMARTVADAATVLGGMTGLDHRDRATRAGVGRTEADYSQYLDPKGLVGARLGVARQYESANRQARAVFDGVVAELSRLGAELVDPVEFRSLDQLNETEVGRNIMLAEFKTGLNRYLATRTGGPRTLADVIQFNADHADVELRWFGQEIFELAEERQGVDDPAYPGWLATARRLTRDEGLDLVLDQHRLDAIIAPTAGPAWTVDLVNGDPGIGGCSTYAAVAGYPLVTVPMGEVDGLPVGLTFMGRAWSEPTLIRLASGFEAAIPARVTPRFLPTIDRRPSAASDGLDLL